MTRIKKALSNEVVAVACVAFAGLLLRLHGLADQSAWSDEWCSIVNDPSMTLSEFFALHRYRNPDHVPLYYLLVYAWSMLISPSLYSVRLISVAFATLAVPVVYLCGREVGGKRAGLVMAALFCVSPYFTFQAQGIRPYALVLLLCAIVLLSLMRAPRSRGVSWWAINYLANMLLIYVHLAGTFFLAAQGLYLLLVYRRRLMPVVLWSSAHFLSLLPAVLSMMVPPQDPMFEIPDLSALLNNLFADDAAGRNIELIYGYPAWKYSHPVAWEMVFSLRPYMGHAMITVFGVLTAWAVIVLVRTLLRSEVDDLERRRHAALALMLFVAVVPTLMLLVVSYIKEPMPMPRYTVYSNLGLFGMAGAFVASARLAWLRSGALAALAVLYLYQIVYTINTPVRTEWLAVRDEIKRAAAPDDEILVSCYGDPWFDLDRPGELMFRTAYGPAQQAITCVRTQEGLLRRTVETLASNEPGKSVWLVIYRVYDKRLLPEMEAALSGQSLNFQRWDYEAMEGLTLYRVQRGDGIPRLDSLGEVPHLTPADADQVLRDWDITLDTPSERDEAHRALRRLLDRPPPHPLGAMSYAYLSLLAGVEAPKLALHLAESSLSYEPELATAHFARGIALLQLGRLEEGIASFKTAQASPVDELHAFISPLLEALIARDFVSAEKRMERYMLLGGPMTSALPVWLAQHNAAPVLEVTQAVPQE